MKRTLTSKPKGTLLLGETSLYKEVSPNSITSDVASLPLQSHQKVMWVCEKDHEWEAPVSERTRGRGCPYCSNKKVLSGFNDLATLKPKVAVQLDSSVMGNVSASMIYANSTKKVSWVCSEDHRWEASPRGRKTDVCPFCSNQKVLAGFNDLSTTHPLLAVQLHPVLNDIKPTDISAGTGRKLWWKCEKNHEWQATGYERSKKDSGCPYCAGRNVIPGTEDTLAAKYPHLVVEWHPTKNGILLPTDAMPGTNLKAWWICSKGHEWQTQTYNLTGGAKKGCPSCSSNISKMEDEVAAYLEGKGLSLVRSTRRVIAPQELDIYVPDKGVAIEFNGLYWHTEDKHENPKYHYVKWAKSKEAGVQLIQIWEDDWVRNPSLVKRMLDHKLGMSTSKLYARMTEVVNVGRETAKVFLDEFHIQGYASGTVRVGLTHNGVVVSLAVIREEKRNGETILNLVRFATSVHVVGGFSKIVSHLVRHYPDVKGVVTFSDNCVSDGNLYEANGFVAECVIRPDYSYLVRGRREHKFKYRVKKFRNDPSLSYVEGMSEKELAELNSLPRIWDAGKVRWFRNFTG